MAVPELTIAIGSYLEPVLVERIAAAGPSVRVLYEPDLLPVPRYRSDHTGLRRDLSEAALGNWRALTARADIFFDFDWLEPEAMPRHSPNLRWIQATSAGIGGFMQRVGTIVRSHHERWDGDGYPDGLAGEQIPVEARIITACDSWNAMRTDRSYRTALPYETAYAEMETNSERQFDPQVVAVLLELVDETEGAAARLAHPEPAAAESISGAYTEASAAGEAAGWGAPHAQAPGAGAIVQGIRAADGGNCEAGSIQLEHPRSRRAV